jgi:hypothetical protein
MITVTIWHNVALDGQGHHTGMLEGYQPGDPVVRVFTYQAAPVGSPEEIAEEAFGICNGHPRDARGQHLARRYYQRELRSLSAGDVVAVGEVALAVGRPAGWTPVCGGLNEVRTDEHGTHPLRHAVPSRTPQTARPFPAQIKERPDDDTQAEPRDHPQAGSAERHQDQPRLDAARPWPVAARLHATPGQRAGRGQAACPPEDDRPQEAT